MGGGRADHGGTAVLNDVGRMTRVTHVPSVVSFHPQRRTRPASERLAALMPIVFASFSKLDPERAMLRGALLEDDVHADGL